MACSASVEEVTSGSSQSDLCHTLSTKPDSTLTADTLSTDGATSSEPETVDCKAIDTDKTDSVDGEDSVDMDKQKSGGSDGVLKPHRPDTCDVLVTGSPESGDCEGMVGTEKQNADQCVAVTQIPDSGIGDSGTGDGMTLPSSCSSDQDTSVNCSSSVEDLSLAKDTSGKTVTPVTQQPVAANMTDNVSVESSVSTDTPVSDNTSNVDSAHDPVSTASVEPMDQD